MKLNKLAAGAAMALALGTGASAITYDFNVGIGGGFSSPLFLAPYTEGISNNIEAFAWHAGGFLGAGIMLDIDNNVTNSVGLEYSVAYRGDYIEWKPIADTNFMMGTIVQNLDAYYKLGIKPGSLPMDLQFNVGLAYRMLVDYEFNNGVFKQVTDNLYGFGVHTGIRFNVHMLYLAMDYTYMPSVIDGSTNAPSPANFYGINEHTIGVSIGIMLNKTILDSFMGK